MYPVITFIRHKGIAAVLACSKIINKATKGKYPSFYFTPTDELEDINSNVKVIEKDKTSVTIAKVDSEGKILNDDFRVMTTTDFHLDPDNNHLNRKSIRMFVKQIKDNKPDLVILTGDIIESDCQQIDAVQFSIMMEKLGVHWCYVFGNHETREEKGYFKYLLYKGLSYCPHCINRFGDEKLFGYGNFAVNIKNSENSLLKTLFLFDSGRNIQPEVKEKLSLPENLEGYDFIKPEQIEFYLDTIEQNKKKYNKAGTMCFMHIPIPEYKEVFDGSEKEGFTPSGKAELLYGTQFESIGCSPYNSGFFEKAKQEGSIQAFYSGHDHINDFCAVYEGVYLIYSQCGGYNTYSMMDKAGWDEKDCHFGATLTTLSPDGSILPEQKKHSVYLK